MSSEKGHAQHPNLQFADSGEPGMAEHKHEITQRHVQAAALTSESILLVVGGPAFLMCQKSKT